MRPHLLHISTPCQYIHYSSKEFTLTLFADSGLSRELRFKHGVSLVFSGLNNIQVVGVVPTFIMKG